MPATVKISDTPREAGPPAGRPERRAGAHTAAAAPPRQGSAVIPGPVVSVLVRPVLLRRRAGKLAAKPQRHPGEQRHAQQQASPQRPASPVDRSTHGALASQRPHAAGDCLADRHRRRLAGVLNAVARHQRSDRVGGGTGATAAVSELERCAARANTMYTTEKRMPMSAAGTPTRASARSRTGGPGARRASGTAGCLRQASTAKLSTSEACAIAVDQAAPSIPRRGNGPQP